MANYTIIQVNPVEIDKYKDIIIGLWKINLSNGSDERFEWLYHKNPAGSAVTWLAKDEKTGEFVGCNSLYPREVRINGKIYKMGIAIDFAVNKNYRVFGPALQIEKTITANSKAAGFDFLFAWPSPSSTGVFIRAGYNVLGEVDSFVKLLRTKDKLLKVVKIPLFADLLAFFADCFLGVLPDLRYRLTKPGYFKGEIVKICGSEFDILWNQVKDDNEIKTDKSSTYLNWRYTHNNTEQYSFFSLIDKRDNTIKGFIVYSLKDKAVLVWDWVALKREYLDYLLSEFAVFLTGQNASTIFLAFLRNEASSIELKKHYFFRKIVKRPCVIFTDNKDLLAEVKTLVRQNKWWFTDGEMDL